MDSDVISNDTAYFLSLIHCPYVSLYYERSTYFTYNLLAVAVVNCITMVPAILFNFCVVIALLRNRKLLQQQSNLALFGLGVADFLSGSLVQPLLSVMYFIVVIRGDNRPPCHLILVTSLAGYTLCGVSLMTVSFITWERYIAMFRTFSYSSLVTTRSIVMATMIIWAVSLFTSFYCVFEGKRVAFFVINAVIICGTYGWTAYAYARILRRVWSLTNVSKTSGDFDYGSVQLRATRVVGFIVVTLLVCFAFQVAIAVLRTCGLQSRILDNYIEFWAYTLGLANSSLNPVFYCYFNPDIRREVHRIFNCHSTRVNAAEQTKRHKSLTISTTAGSALALGRGCLTFEHGLEAIETADPMNGQAECHVNRAFTL